MQKLKQEDRNLLYEFFSTQLEWMHSNSLLDIENLGEFKKRFLVFLKEKECEKNSACQLFLDLLTSEEERLLKDLEQEKKRQKRVKLKCYPICRTVTDNPLILAWVKEASIVREVSSYDLQVLNQSLKQKLDRNKWERRESEKLAKDFIVKES